jgi:hypothetical protein
VIATVFAQFRNQYSSGGLTTELLMLHDGQYVVRATAMVEGQPLATAMATHTDLETAEERAQTRVLQLLGIAAIESSTPALPKTMTASSPPLRQPPLTEPVATPPAEPAAQPVVAPVAAEVAPPSAPAPATAVAAPPPSALAMHTQESLETSTSPVDLSDVIAQIDVEMARLGWSSQQGREYLEQTYGKRSRQQLSDEELVGFLLHLESQPTPAG